MTLKLSIGTIFPIQGMLLFLSSTFFVKLSNVFRKPTLLEQTKDDIRDHLTKVSITKNSKTIILESFDDYDHRQIQSNDSNDNNASSKDINGMSRSESEYSLGISRSKSFQKLMSEIGPFCDTGEIIIKILRFGGLAILTAFIASNLYRKKKN